MKKIILTAALFASIFTANAQSPNKMSYQAVVRNTSNALITNAAIGVQISIVQGSANGSIVYSETHSATTNANGLTTVEIGAGGNQQGDFSTINWSNGPYFLRSEIDPNGGVSYTIYSTSELLSVPYAKHASVADELSTPITETQGLNSVLMNSGNGGGMSVFNVSSLTVGASNPTDGAALDVKSTNGAFMPPRMSTSQRNAITPTEGMMIYNTDLGKFQGVVPSTGTPVVDQNCNAAMQGGTVLNSSFTISGQSFTAGMTGTLTQIDVEIHSTATPGDFTLEIREGEGIAGTLLSSQTVSISGSGNSSFTISNPPNVTSGQIYSYIFKWESGAGSTAFSDNSTNPYAGGGSINPGGVVAGCCDFIFKTYVASTTPEWVDLH